MLADDTPTSSVIPADMVTVSPIVAVVCDTLTELASITGFVTSVAVVPVTVKFAADKS
ncbi:hypothetical protein SDC9_158611 [bioreactor metagenome]|uniref:Uncharacterized protein n=1 Tax=bioreactor metagenome TaxID=1076179 RepID=A0A645FBL1_9ZZZZ